MFAGLWEACWALGLADRKLLPPPHVFIDSLGYKLPYAMAKNGWKQYFTMVPDYNEPMREKMRAAATPQ